jgi:predicted house-cleaning noncanonical NTP pyrophosphatase (MazG superfamily)
MSSADPPPAPDYSGVAAASEKSAQLSYDMAMKQFDFYKQQYDENKEVSDVVIDKMLGSLDKSEARADEQYARYQETFQPLEDQLAQEAQDYASPEKMEKEAGKAEADVAQQMEQARQTAQQKLEQYGVDPSETRQGALDLQSRVAEAAAQASAGNQARDRVENTGRALRSEAINVGKGFPGQTAAFTGLSQQAGNQAVNTGLATTASGVQSMGSPTSWQGLGNQAVGQWGNILHQGYEDEMSGYKAEQSSSSGFGSLLGAGMGLASKFLTLEEGSEIPPTQAAPPPRQQAIPLSETGRGIPAAMSPSGGQQVDDVPAQVNGGPPAALNAGEFVVPKDVVNWKGEEWLQKEIMKARKSMTGQQGERPAQAQAIPVSAAA